MRMKVISTCRELKLHVGALKKANKTIGVVPTMGALHAGHLSLVQRASESSDESIVTVFVNPTQFAKGEDLDQYPQSLEDDVEKLNSMNVSTVFVPSRDEMYPPGWATRVEPSGVSQLLEGEFRPAHFGGVATVVLKLLNLTGADNAYFGQKDFQQALVIKNMVDDLNVPVEIITCPIIREGDGLALSSRNIYLSPDERTRALALVKTLDHVKKLILDGDQDGHALMSEMRQMLIDEGVSGIDYAVIANPVSLEVYDQVELPAVALIAVHVGGTRLIDNCLIDSI